jgi:glycosyltransferase involved in cell wall biosynthesis
VNAAAPKVSVVMSVFNGEGFVAAAITSVLEQTLVGFELVVVDDGSTDSTPAILAEFAAEDDRVAVHRHANQGLSASLNRGIELARAPLIARLDADDIALPTRLELQVDFLDRHEAVGLVGGAARFIDDEGHVFAEAVYPTSDSETRLAFAHSTPFVHSAVTFRRAAFQATEGYRGAFVDAEDLDLWLRIAEQHDVLNLPQQVVGYRIHAGQATFHNLERQATSALAARTAWRARAAGEPDPFLGVRHIDRAALDAAGLTEADVTAEFIPLATWLAKTIARAGQQRAADELFAAALERARLSGTPAMVAEIQRQQGRVAGAEARRPRNRLRSVRSWLAARR